MQLSFRLLMQGGPVSKMKLIEPRRRDLSIAPLFHSSKPKLTPHLHYLTLFLPIYLSWLFTKLDSFLSIFSLLQYDSWLSSSEVFFLIIDESIWQVILFSFISHCSRSSTCIFFRWSCWPSHLSESKALSWQLFSWVQRTKITLRWWFELSKKGRKREILMKNYLLSSE